MPAETHALERLLETIPFVTMVSVREDEYRYIYRVELRPPSYPPLSVEQQVSIMELENAEHRQGLIEAIYHQVDTMCMHVIWNHAREIRQAELAQQQAVEGAIRHIAENVDRQILEELQATPGRIQEVAHQPETHDRLYAIWLQAFSPEIPGQYFDDVDGTVICDDSGNTLEVDNVFDEIERKMKELGVE